MTEEPKTFSIALRLRRVTYEDAYVAVPVSDAIMKVNEDGTSAIDFEVFTAEAMRIGENAGVEWQIEERQTEAHPIQTPLPEGRSRFDAYYGE